MMEDQEFRNKVKRIYLGLALFFGILIMGSGGIMYKMINPSFLIFDKKEITETYVEAEDFDKIENGIHLGTGFKDDEGLQTVIVSCTPCHSAKLVTQNRANKEGWISIIRWMQETQNLWDLGNNEAIIVNYLAKNYAPEEKGRRDNLEDVEWYDLEN
ncbi:monoheme cytochrome C [Flavivirga sp. MEBiC05379]|uniref:Monoheme cytochrome C n=2 Tax=Flavivirga spongiicola TaxID=421621 RepID=A0ABU7XYL0_9FLAO|nr:monoheme cytochrome C [Flavivirga sp. MEBiC05379]MDO5980638.1 monoheme cytochrome C [Flavivirga sp. MEBiC05379]